jgi:hypothetical protein
VVNPIERRKLAETTAQNSQPRSSPAINSIASSVSWPLAMTINSQGPSCKRHAPEGLLTGSTRGQTECAYVATTC